MAKRRHLAEQRAGAGVALDRLLEARGRAFALVEERHALDDQRLRLAIGRQHALARQAAPGSDPPRGHEQQREEHERRSRDEPPAATRPALDAAHEPRPTRAHGPPFEPAAEIVAEAPGVGVALARVLLAAERRRLPPERPRFGGENRHDRAMERRRGGLVGDAAREELVRDDPERVDVGRRTDAGGLGLDLLGAHVLRCPHELAGARRELGGTLVAGEQPRDAEVDDHRPAVRPHQDVARFQIAVNDPVRVRVLNRVAHRGEERDARLESEPGSRRVLLERSAVHVLHGDPGLRHATRARHLARVEHARDPRVVEASEDLGLEPEPCAHFGRDRTGREQLDRGRPAITRAELAQVDDAHSAPPELAHEPPRADPAAGGGRELGERVAPVERRVEQGVLLAVQEEELQNLASQRLVPGARAGEERRAPAPRNVEGVEEDLLDALVVGARYVVRRPAHFSSSPTCRA